MQVNYIFCLYLLNNKNFRAKKFQKNTIAVDNSLETM